MYILECSDGSFYTGSTNNLELRLKQHEVGEGSNHTKKHLPVKLVYCEEFERIDSAFYREKQIQGWNRKKKEALIAGFWEKLNELAECKNESHSKNKTSAPLSRQDVENIASTVAERSRSHMIIIISNPTPIENETAIVNQLFENGLELFHVRKYDYSKSEVENYINNINENHYSRLVLNSYHKLANQFNIKRLHFSERDRLSKTENDFKQLVEDGFILSTSVHSVEEFNTLSSCFSYAFLSPVFDSISKTDYKAKIFDLKEYVASTPLSHRNPNPVSANDVFTEQRWLSGAEAKLQRQSIKKTKLIALGGITPENYKTALEMGFDGVALMGSIWQSENKVENYLRFKK